jgi:hypothetical protein
MLMLGVNRNEHTQSCMGVGNFSQAHYFQYTENPQIMQAEHTHKFMQLLLHDV